MAARATASPRLKASAQAVTSCFGVGPMRFLPRTGLRELGAVWPSGGRGHRGLHEEGVVRALGGHRPESEAGVERPGRGMDNRPTASFGFEVPGVSFLGEVIIFHIALLRLMIAVPEHRLLGRFDQSRWGLLV